MAEDEFANRDAMGLEKSPKLKSEKEARANYLSMVGNIVVWQAPLLSYIAYFVLRLVPGYAERIDAKFSFIRDHDLGWAFVSAFVVFLTRSYLTVNANGARAGARLDRPDQHIYKIMSQDNAFADAPYVLMASSGTAGRFNRAQRAAYNFDEAAPCFLVNLCLVAAVFGPLALMLGLAQMYGRTLFAHLYTDDQSKRGAGFMISVIVEYLTAGLVSLCALKAFIPALP